MKLFLLRHPVKALVLIVAVLVASTALTSCNTAPPPGGTSLTITAYFTGPMYPLDNSWGSPAFPILVGHVNSCVNLDPTGTTYRAACRVVNGYDWGGGSSPALNDTTNWDIKIIAGHSKSAINNPGYGYSINPYFTPYCQGDCAPNNAINEFEGCTKVASWDGQWPLHSAATSTDEWRCDYAVYDWAMIKPASTSWSSDVMAALWPSWWRHTADDAACAPEWAPELQVIGRLYRRVVRLSEVDAQQRAAVGCGRERRIVDNDASDDSARHDGRVTE